MLPHCSRPDAISAELKTSVVRGLEEAEADSRRNEFGRNELREAPRRAAWRRFLDQFQDLVVWMLIIAAVISGFMGDLADTVAILAIVLLNGLIGFFQQERAEHAIAALRRLSSPVAKVIRDGALRSVPAAELVPGDLIELEAGDYIPADARLTETVTLKVQEASLTGESTPVDKDAQAEPASDAALADRRNMIYLGTVAATGRARALVVATGMQTELGKIAGMLQSEPQEPTPLQRRLTELGKVLAWGCLAIVAVVYALEVARSGEWFKTFLVAVSLAVAAVPEGLPAVVTLALALGLQRMARRNALVRKLPSVETLGSVTVICSDKTGTLTRNEMTVRAVLAGGTEYRVSGTGYSPTGEFFAGEEPVNAANTPDLRQILLAAARCNNAQLRPPQGDAGVWTVVGDPTEGALLVAAWKADVVDSPPRDERIAEIPFDSQRKAMSTVHREQHGSVVMYAKGAPEVILPLCTHELIHGESRILTDERRNALFEQCARLAADALRVLAFAYRSNPVQQAEGYAERDFVFAGVCGMIDPPRDEAKAAVAAARGAGIRPIMITGDHPETARAIATELGILSANGVVITGQELEQRSDDWLAENVERIAVYARVSAEHKLRVVRAWKKRGDVAAMTGDGVNDAPAVKAADIGIAMGISGTDVTKEASDMVLTDDNFQSIVAAVEEGRCIFENIQNVIRYLLSCNAGEVLFMLFAALAGWPIPLAAIQILWINLITDGLPALALVMEPPDRLLMQRPPHPPRRPVLTVQDGVSILISGAFIAAATAAGFWLVYQGEEANLAQARTTAFCILAFSQLFFSLACRSSRFTLPELGLRSNPHLLIAIVGSAAVQLAAVTLPFMQSLLNTSADPFQGWMLIAALSLAPVSIIETAKLIFAARRRLSAVASA